MGARARARARTSSVRYPLLVSDGVGLPLAALLRAEPL